MSPHDFMVQYILYGYWLADSGNPEDAVKDQILIDYAYSGVHSAHLTNGSCSFLEGDLRKYSKVLISSKPLKRRGHLRLVDDSAEFVISGINAPIIKGRIFCHKSFLDKLVLDSA